MRDINLANRIYDIEQGLLAGIANAEESIKHVRSDRFKTAYPEIATTEHIEGAVKQAENKITLIKIRLAIVQALKATLED